MSAMPAVAFNIAATVILACTRSAVAVAEHNIGSIAAAQRKTPDQRPRTGVLWRREVKATVALPVSALEPSGFVQALPKSCKAWGGTACASLRGQKVLVTQEFYGKEWQCTYNASGYGDCSLPFPAQKMHVDKDRVGKIISCESSKPIVDFGGVPKAAFSRVSTPAKHVCVLSNCTTVKGRTCASLQLAKVQVTKSFDSKAWACEGNFINGYFNCKPAYPKKQLHVDRDRIGKVVACYYGKPIVDFGGVHKTTFTLVSTAAKHVCAYS